MTRLPSSFRIGTQGWNYADWLDAFYPLGTRPADFLETYARAFGTVEVDSTFYAVPASKTVRGWAARTPPGFVFALKLPQQITHERRLRDAGDVLEEFLERARELGPKLGPVLIQMGPDFGPSEMDALARFLAHLPGDVRFAVELRQQGWTTGVIRSEILAHLTDHCVALCLSDGPWTPRERLLELAARPTAPFHYVRWMGPDRALTDHSRVQVDRSAEQTAWTAALLASPPGTEVWGYTSNYWAGHAPATARDLQRRLGQAPTEPEQIAEQTSLF